MALLIGLMLCASRPVIAQRTLLWNDFYNPGPRAWYFNSVTRLRTNRYLSVGFSDTLIVNSIRQRPGLLITDSLGQPTRQLVLSTINAGQAWGAVSDRQGGAYITAFLVSGSSTIGYQLLRLDSTGNINWRRQIPYPYVSFKPTATQPLPDGYQLIGTRYIPRPGMSSGQRAEVVQYDARGQIQWSQVFGGKYAYAYAAAPMPNGSTAVLSEQYVDQPGYPYEFVSDHFVNYFSAYGDSLGRARIGWPGYRDVGNSIIATTDGGVAFVGYRYAQNNAPREGVFIKLDSLGRREWYYLLVSSQGSNSFGAELKGVQEIASGHFVVMGRDYFAPMMMMIAPPTTPADSVGRVLWQHITAPRTLPNDWVYEPGGTAYLSGYGYRTNGPQESDGAAQRWSGLPRPVQPDLCARPPVFGQAPTHGPFVGSTMSFSLDPLTTQPGPRYGAVNLVRWEWGDGTPADTGWTVSHTFTSPTPVRVRVCATNNLWCQTCVDLYPLGPLSAREEREELAASLSIFPNPSATGVFTVRATTAPGAHLTVTDAVGRQVCQGPATGPETRLDLSHQPAGLYGLRLTWPDGRTVTKKLVR